MATLADSMFIHKRLHDDTQRVRLCKFNRNQPGLITCTLKEADITSESCPPFRALSYEWGPSYPPRMIMVDGYFLEIRENLYQYLDQAECHHQWDTPWIFIDQVSIDQANTLERSHQVQMMGTIFSRAEVVIAWIGLSDAHSDIVVDAINARSLTEKLSWQRDGPLVHKLVEQRLFPEMTLGELAGWVPFSRQRSYFGRLWVVQEILLARVVLIACGTVRPFPWQALRLLDWLPWPIDYDRRFGTGNWTHLKQLNVYYDQTENLDLYTVLEAYARHECTDPRDKVYGLQGLVMKSERVPIDYSRSVSDIYVDTAIVLAKFALAERLPDILGILMRMGIDRKHTDLQYGDKRFEEFAKHIYSTDVNVEHGRPGYQERHR